MSISYMTEKSKATEISDQEDFSSSFAIIPSYVLEDQSLSIGAKLLYSWISMYANRGKCWASNRHFGEKLGVKIRSIQNWLKELTDQSYIQVEVIYDSVQTKRNIWLSDDFRKRFKTPQFSKINSTSDKNSQPDSECTPPCNIMHPPPKKGTPPHAPECTSIYKVYKSKDKSKDNVSDVAVELTHLLFSLIKKHNRKFPSWTPAKFQKEARVIDSMLTEEKPEDLKQAMEEADRQTLNSDTSFKWFRNILSAEKFKKHYPRLFEDSMDKPKEEIKKEEEKNKIDIIKGNRDLARAMYQKIKEDKRRFVTLSDNCVHIKSPHNDAVLSLPFAINGFMYQLDNSLRKNEIL